MYQIGRVCVKTAGRDSNKYCVIVAQVDDRHVIVDGQTRRKKVNILHIEPTQKTVTLSANADSAHVIKALKTIGIEVEKKGEARKTGPRPVRVKASKAAPATDAKADKKPAAKAPAAKKVKKAE